MAYQHKRFITLVGLGVLALALMACPASVPCDEEVGDPQAYYRLVLSHPVVVQINDELGVPTVDVAPCFVNGKVRVCLTYRLAQSYSQYSILYHDQLILACAKDGMVEISDEGIRRPEAFDRDSILGFFKTKVNEVENNARVREFLTKIGPRPGSRVSLHRAVVEIHGPDTGWIEYSLYKRQVRGYLLPNTVSWQEFPEIEQAHKIIEENLLTGELSNCSIGREKHHSYTTASFHDFETGPWYLTVALICQDGWKDAFLQLNHDGSYERLCIKMEY